MESYVDDWFGLILFFIVFTLLPAIAGGSIIYYVSGFVPWLAGFRRKLMRTAAWGISVPLLYGVLFSIFFSGFFLDESAEFATKFAAAFLAAMQIFFVIPPINYVFLSIWLLGLFVVAVKVSLVDSKKRVAQVKPAPKENEGKVREL